MWSSEGMSVEGRRYCFRSSFEHTWTWLESLMRKYVCKIPGILVAGDSVRGDDHFFSLNHKKPGSTTLAVLADIAGLGFLPYALLCLSCGLVGSDLPPFSDNREAVCYHPASWNL